jgi:hypothetical protein
MNRKLNKAHCDFSKAMWVRLLQKEHAGYSGWDGEGEHAVNFFDLFKGIRKDLDDVEGWHGAKCQQLAVDIANRCMMLWYQQEKASKP